VTVDRLLDFAVTINPGFYLIIAALMVAVAKDAFTRAVALIGGPVLALLAMLYPPVSGRMFRAAVPRFRTVAVPA
jgi:hypothetical protein